MRVSLRLDMAELDKKRVQPPKILLLALLALGVAGNLFKVSLFFGVDFIFGSVAVLIGTAIFGPFWGTLIAAIPAIQTITIWNHPCAAIVLIFEALIVGLLVKRYRANLAIAGLVYWFFIGLPLILLFYFLALGMEFSDALLAALKSAANGIINSIFASLFITWVPWPRGFQGLNERNISLFETLFNVFIAAALIPIFFLVTVDARRAVQDVEYEAIASLKTISTGLSLSVTRWRDEHIRSIDMLADTIESIGVNRRGEVQGILSRHKKVWPDFHGVFMTNAKGVTVAFEPLLNVRGESTIGISFADREYFQVMKAGRTSPHISPVFMARGGVFEPVFNITRALRPNGHFVGIISSSLNLVELEAILKNVTFDIDYVATLIDANGAVIASTRPGLKPMESYIEQKGASMDMLENGLYHHWPEPKGFMSPMTRWKSSSLGKLSSITGAGSWTLIVEVPLRSFQSALQARYLRILGVLLFLAFVLLLTSFRMAAAIARPLGQLSLETTDIAERLRLKQKILWPTSRLFEVSVLVQNFHSAIDALNERFQELESSRSQLDQVNRSKDEFLSVASHELKTPLTPLRMQIQMLQLKFKRGKFQELTPEALQRTLGAMELQINRITRLIDDLLDVARINAGKLKLSGELVDVAALFRDVAERYTPHLHSSGCELELRIPERAEAFVDPLRIEQVLVNLLINAAKYASGKPVVVSLLEEGENLKFLVLDQGPGIPEEAQKRIFQKFERFTSEDKIGGLGLGLFISRQILEAHGGHIELSSAHGAGSSFVVTLPKKGILADSNTSS